MHMNVYAVWCFSSSWRLRCWHPHQQHQLRAPWWQPTMVCCHLETTMMIHDAICLTSQIYPVTAAVCWLPGDLPQMLQKKKPWRQWQLQAHRGKRRGWISRPVDSTSLSTITILQGIVYVFCIFDDIRCPRCIPITYQDKSRMCQHDSTCLEYHMLNINGVTWDVEWWTTA